MSSANRGINPLALSLRFPSDGLTAKDDTVPKDVAIANIRWNTSGVSTFFFNLGRSSKKRPEVSEGRA